MTRRRSSITGAATGATTVATETVCDFSSTVSVGLPAFAGNGRPGALFFAGTLFFRGLAATAFFAGAFFAGAFFAAFFGATFFVALFFTAAFLATGFFFAFEADAAAFFTTFFADTPRTLCAFPTSTKYATRSWMRIVEK
jgi:hypothetical protein